MSPPMDPPALPRPLDAAALMAAWRAAGLLAPGEDAALAQAIRAQAGEDQPPLYLKILSAVGTLLATVFFLGVLELAGLISVRDGSGLLAWGVALLAAGLALSLALRRIGAGLARDAVLQTAFTALALGKVAGLAGVVTLAGIDTPWVPTAALLVMTLVTYPVSASSLDRVLSPYAVAVSVLVELLVRRPAGDDPSLAVAALFALAAAVAGALLLSHRAPPVLRPVGLAALGTMGTIVSMLAAGQDAGLWAGGALDPRPVEAVLALALAGVVVWIATGGRATGWALAPRVPLAAAVAGVLALSLAGAPGISFALLVLLVGHALHDLPLRVLGILALPAFLILWYYGRDMSFLEKSAALVGSGALLLIGQGVIAWAGWDREEAP